jgi:hypothetical protein
VQAIPTMQATPTGSIQPTSVATSTPTGQATGSAGIGGTRAAMVRSATRTGEIVAAVVSVQTHNGVDVNMSAASGLENNNQMTKCLSR